MNSRLPCQNVGILAMQIYIPTLYVSQSQLETFDGVSEGKYTIGLGQSKMGFCNDREDIHSICLTVVESLLSDYGISYHEIGRLEVGTETIIDKSKSVKSVLMSLFVRAGNSSVEGSDAKNACYGGTAALFNSLAWIESSAWDGRYALVVAADIAVYASGPARPTGGAGALALLLGPNAPLVFDSHLRVSYMDHTYDFYKPDLVSEYPVVDGQLSAASYLTSLSATYQGFVQKMDAWRDKMGHPNGNQVTQDRPRCSLQDFSHIIFHSPYGKLVQKAFARLFLIDFLNERGASVSELEPLRPLLERKTCQEGFGLGLDREMEKLVLQAAQADFLVKTWPSLHCSREVGNMYCGSLYAGLLSLLTFISSTTTTTTTTTNHHHHHHPASHPSSDPPMIGLFSYGSGLAATFFSLRLVGCIQNIVHKANLLEKLAARSSVDPLTFSNAMRLREQAHSLRHPEPTGSIAHLAPGTWYLAAVDEKFRRSYLKVPEASEDGSLIL